MPEKVRSLSRFFLTDPEDVTIEVEGGSPQKIEHYYYLAPASEKEALLARILDYEDPESAIIFCNTKADVRFITAYLAKRGHNIDQISGDLAQAAREKAIAKIKAGKLRYLVATDVAARGIDISDLAYVINYTTSDSPEVYVHRTGRTGRAGKSGVALSIVSGLDIGNFKHMQIVSGIKIEEKKAPTERDVARRKKRRAEEQPKAGTTPSTHQAREKEESEDTEDVLSPAPAVQAPATEEPFVSEASSENQSGVDDDEKPRSRRRRRRRGSSTESSTLTPASSTGDADDVIKRLKAQAERALTDVDADAAGEQIERFLPFVRQAAETEEGFRELASICAALVRAPANAPAVEEPAPSETGSRRRRSSRAARNDHAADASGDDPEIADAARDARPAQDDGNDRPRRRRRRGEGEGIGRNLLSEDDATRAERPPRRGGDDRGRSGDRSRGRRRSGGGR